MQSPICRETIESLCSAAKRLTGFQRRQFQAEMAEKYKIKTKFLGPSSPAEQEIRVLSRTFRWIAEGVEYEADQRHAELIIKGMEIEHTAPAHMPGVART